MKSKRFKISASCSLLIHREEKLVLKKGGETRFKCFPVIITAPGSVCNPERSPGEMFIMFNVVALLITSILAKIPGRISLIFYAS